MPRPLLLLMPMPLFLLPSPLRGGVGGAGRAIWHIRAKTSLPPTPTLPHNGGGRQQGLRGGGDVLGLPAAAAALLIAAPAGWIVALGPPPLGKDLDVSVQVLDRDGRLLRAYTTPDGRWRLPASVESVDKRFVAALLRTRTSASSSTAASIH